MLRSSGVPGCKVELVLIVLSVLSPGLRGQRGPFREDLGALPEALIRRLLHNFLEIEIVPL